MVYILLSAGFILIGVPVTMLIIDKYYPQLRNNSKK